MSVLTLHKTNTKQGDMFTRDIIESLSGGMLVYFLYVYLFFAIGTLGMGITGTVTSHITANTDHPAVLDKVHGNLLAVPVPDTLHLVPTSGGGKYKTGEVICETFYAWNRHRQEECPR